MRVGSSLLIVIGLIGCGAHEEHTPPPRDPTCSPGGVATSLWLPDRLQLDVVAAGDLIAVTIVDDDYRVRVVHVPDGVVRYEWRADEYANVERTWLGGDALVVLEKVQRAPAVTFRLWHVDLTHGSQTLLFASALPEDALPELTIPRVAIAADGRIALDDNANISLRSLDGTWHTVVPVAATRTAFRAGLSLADDELVYAEYTHPPGDIERLGFWRVDLATGVRTPVVGSTATRASTLPLLHNARYLVWNGLVFDRGKRRWLEVPFAAAGLDDDWVCGAIDGQPHLYNVSTHALVAPARRTGTTPYHMRDACSLAARRLVFTANNDGALPNITPSQEAYCYDW